MNQGCGGRSIGPFRGDWDFLSNHFPSEVELAGRRYPTVEHAYQAAKTTDESKREMIRVAVGAGEAKRLGRQVEMRDEWLGVRDQVMLSLLRQKFADPLLRRRLIETGDRPIVEVNTWGDTYWGVCNGVGSNRLGELLQQVRDEIAADGEDRRSNR